MAVLLSTTGISKSFGGIAAVQDLDLSLEQGIITALIGPNGAGKTTIFNLITGNIPPDKGEVKLDGRSIGGLPPHRVARLGVGRTFQGLNLFDHMTVRENVETALEKAAWFWQSGGRSGARSRRETVDAVLEQTGLTALAGARAVDLAYAERKFLSLARIKAAGARIWLLDEPASGLDYTSRARFVSIVKEATRNGVTLCLIEHNLDIVLQLADRIVFLDRGRKLAEGDPQEIVQDPALADVYFGKQRQ